MVEYPAVAGGELVDQIRGKDVGFSRDYIAPVVFNVLVAAKGVGFRPRRRTARDKVRCLVVAEAGKNRILAGKIVIETNVKGSFVELSHRLVLVVEAGIARKTGSRRRIKLSYRQPYRINQGCGNYGAGSKAWTWRLASVDGRRLGKTRRSTAFKRARDGGTGRGRSEGIRERVGRLYAKRIAAEIIIPIGVGCRHCSGRNEPRKGYALTLHLGLIIDKEKSFVLPDGSAQRTAKLIQIEFLFGREEIAGGIKVGITKELKQRTVPLI